MAATDKSAEQIVKEYNEIRFKLAETRGYLKAVGDVRELSLVENELMDRAFKKHKRTEALLDQELRSYQITYPEYLI